MDKKPYHRPTGKGSRGPYTKDGIPPIILPEAIRLPDGRRFTVMDLLKTSRKELKHHNLLNQRLAAERPVRPGRLPKYTIDERRWQAEADYRDIMEKYGMSKIVAKSTKSQARKIVDVVNEHGEGAVIYNYSKAKAAKAAKAK